METMYDKLGDLLSETLKEGSVKFVKFKRDFEEETEPLQNTASFAKRVSSAETIAEENVFAETTSATESAKQEAKKQNYKDSSKQKKTYSRVKRIYPFAVDKNTISKVSLPSNVQKAYNTLQLDFDSTLEDIKKVYKEKLKYYHPDKYNNNPVLQKIATNKTRQIVEAFTVINNFFESK